MADDIVSRLLAMTITDWEGDEVTDPLCEEAAKLIARLRRAGDALSAAYQESSGRDSAVRAWQEARRG